MTRWWAIGMLLVVTGCSTVPARFTPANPMAPSEFSHALFEQVLKDHVKDGVVDYPAIQTDDRLAAYLAQLERVAPDTFATRNEQLSFWINAYNAFTIDLILTRYPRLESIKDLGNFLSSPWKQRWISLLGETVSLDVIEHGMLRKRGVYDDPRIHFAVNCASIGCPMLREEAYIPEQLEQQLESQMRRFMADRERNRWNSKAERLELSRIFDWYAEDFRLGHQGIFSLHGLAARFADVLADREADRARVRSTQVLISYLDYDWRLNDAKVTS